MKPEGALFIILGIFLGMLPGHLVSSFPSSGTNSGPMIQIPRLGTRSSKDNGIANAAQYALHRPYKADFDLLRVSERSQELAMPFVLSNDLDGDNNDAAIRILTSDPTLRSRRKRQIPLSHQIFFGLNPAFSNNPAGLGNPPAGQRPSALAVPSSSPAFFIPSSSLSQTAAIGMAPAGPATMNRNELAILTNYYQPQQLPPQSPPLQVGIFQGPIPAERQRPQLDGIHTKYPYPYPPTLDVGQQSPVVPESIGAGDENQVTTDYPAESTSSGTTQYPEQNEPEQEGSQDPAVSAAIPDSPAQQSSQEFISENGQASQASSSAPPSSISLPASDSNYPQQIQLQELAMQKRLREKEEEVRVLRSQLEQANLQVVSYEQENTMIKDQLLRSEEANLKLRDRVLQLENSNQHLQDQNGQLQQTTSEQRQQMNGLKTALKEAKDQVAQYEQQQPLSDEAVKHRKEIEGFLIRIRKLGEEGETCKKQVKLYQLKIKYITDQKRQNAKDKDQQEIQDDELDPELSRMDAEIAALQKNADDAAEAINDLPQPNPNLTGAIPESAVPAPVAEQKVVPPQAVEVKKESEFPGEAVQVPQRPQQPEQPVQKTVATAEDVARAPTWEKPAEF